MAGEIQGIPGTGIPGTLYSFVELRCRVTGIMVTRAIYTGFG
jgi:hypothetical protein